MKKLQSLVSFVAQWAMLDWDDDEFPQMRFTQRTEKGDINILITHAWCVLLHKEEIRNMDAHVIVCCHGEAMRKITGEKRIVTSFGQHEVLVETMHLARSGATKVWLTRGDKPYTFTELQGICLELEADAQA